jgi:tRNA-dihydrouridine synthase 2
LSLSQYYLDSHCGLTKFCSRWPRQFKESRHPERLSEAKDYDAVADLLLSARTGEDEFREIEQAIESRRDRYHEAVEQQAEEKFGS